METKTTIIVKKNQINDQCLKGIRGDYLLYKEGKIDKLTLMVYLQSAASVAFDLFTTEELEGKIQRPTPEVLFPDKNGDVTIWVIDVCKYIGSLISIGLEYEEEAKKNLKSHF